MKKLLMLVGVLFLILPLTAQENSEDTVLTNRIKIFFSHNKNLDFKSVVEFVHPSLFKIVPKEKFIESLEQSFTDDEIEIGFDSMNLGAISNPFVLKNVTYRKVNYFTKLHLIMQDEEDFEDSLFQEMMISALKVGFPDSEIVFNTDRKSFDVSSSSAMIAIKDEETEPWFFIEANKNYSFILERIFPEEVISHFNLR